MNDTVRSLWPELEWIKNPELREKTARVWEYALEQSQLRPEDLCQIPFSLLLKQAVNFMAHKRSVVHICRESARIMQELDRSPRRLHGVRAVPVVPMSVG